ncbi:hypothetical protein GCM10023205_53260 [Yinghuangia aomiensis]|uniref:Insertion element IS402-like domain-containing protein n=1 Tax=Yinghuangia aomiensis TaxID=676205 RepID=A0ABP9HU41_9ACTN
MFDAIGCVLTTGRVWHHLPRCLSASESTVHRRFRIWSDAGLWGRLHLRLRKLHAEAGPVNLSQS